MSEEIKKNTPALSWIISIGILLMGLNSICFNTLFTYPVFNLYIQAFAPILLDLVALSAILVFIFTFNKLASKRRYLICVILMIVMSVLWNIVGADYLKDIVVEPKTISSEFYSCNKNFVIYYDETNGDEIILKVNDEQKSEIIQNESNINKSKKLQISDNITIYGMEKAITIEYYPNTKIVKDIKFSE